MIQLPNINGINILFDLTELCNQFPGKVVFTTSFSMEDQVITDIICSNQLPVKIITLDTGRIFEETYNVFSRTLNRYKIEIDKNSETSEQTTKNIPNLNSYETKHLTNDGIVMVGTFVRPNDILVGKVISNNTSEQLPESKLLRAIFGAKAKGVKDNSYRMPDGEYGRVIEKI